MPWAERKPCWQWNAALWCLQGNLEDLASETPLSEDQRQLLGTVLSKCRELVIDPAWIDEPTNQDLAGKYGCSRRSVQYWRKAGCPFDRGRRHVLNWLCQRRQMPSGTKAKFQRQLAGRQSRLYWRGVFQRARAYEQEGARLQRDFAQDRISLPDLMSIQVKRWRWLRAELRSWQTAP